MVPPSSRVRAMKLYDSGRYGIREEQEVELEATMILCKSAGPEPKTGGQAALGLVD